MFEMAQRAAGFYVSGDVRLEPLGGLQNFVYGSEHDGCAARAELMETIVALPRDDGAFGLIHGDMGVGNFTVADDGRITLFDFDEAQYS